MPLYEYRCSKCERVFEIIQKFSDEPLTVHEGCGGAVERLISPPAFQFKGSGWYITDYAKSGGGGKEKPKSSESDSKPASSSSSDSSSSSSSSTKPSTSTTPASKT